jgi:hypothetical protein
MKKNHGWYYLHLTSLNRFLYIICEKIEKFDCMLSMTFISERMLHFIYVLVSANINVVHLPHKKKKLVHMANLRLPFFWELMTVGWLVFLY